MTNTGTQNTRIKVCFALHGELVGEEEGKDDVRRKHRFPGGSIKSRGVRKEGAKGTL